MDLPITILKNIKPYKTAWRIQVKILHSWKQYTAASDETMELILADEEGSKIHAGIKREFVKKYEKYLPTGEWKVITNFKLTHAVGQYRPTDHAYKIGFMKETFVNQTVVVSESLFPNTISFKKINDDYNQNFLCDILGEVINVKELENLDSGNKPLKKLELELRDATDEHLGCTLWNSMAEEMSEACQSAGDKRVICLLRFSKIKEFKGVKSASNSFSTSLLHINPDHPEIEEFKNQLPHDGLAITLSENKPKFDGIVFGNDYWMEQQNITIADLKQSTDVGKVKIMCTIQSIDTDWGWYYIGCTKRNHKKVEHSKSESGQELIQGKGKQPLFWCDMCDANVTHVAAKYKLHLKVKDHTTTTTLLLFDGFAKDIIKKTANELLNGNFDEIVDPEDIPEDLKNLSGKSFQFVLQIEKENLRGHDTFKVAKVLTDCLALEDHTIDEEEKSMNSLELISMDQGTPTLSQEITESGSEDVKTPSLKRKDDKDVIILDEQSTTKKLCFKSIKVEDEKTEEIKDENGKV